MKTHTNYRAAVASEIRAEIARQRMSKVQLAAITGISVRSLARRLNAEAPIDIEDLESIADALGKESHDFLPSRRRQMVAG